LTRSSRLLLTLLAASPAGDLTSDDVPCGSAIIADCAAGAPVVRRAAVLAETYPWAPICCWSATPIEDLEILAAVRALPARALVVMGEPAGLDRNAACIAVLRRITPPSPEAFAEYVVSRTGTSNLAGTLLRALRPSPGDHRSTLSRQLSPLSPLTASDWRRLHLLCHLFAGPPVPAGDAAARAGIDPRRMRAWCTSYLDGPWLELRERFGWRWVPETALRKAGLIATGTAHARTRATA
jgi:hypothetical protein